MTIPPLMTKFVTQMQIHSSELVLLVLHLISKQPTLMQKENAKIHSTSTLLEPLVVTMQCLTVTSLMLTLHSLDALTLIVMQPPKSAKHQPLLQHTLGRVHVVMEEPINVFSVETIWCALITFAVLD
jgi:hypothetical protein